jgi:hypothetical protein
MEYQNLTGYLHQISAAISNVANFFSIYHKNLTFQVACMVVANYTVAM